MVGGALAALVCAAPASAEIKAGAASIDATWHVGASAGQYSPTNPLVGTDPLNADFDFHTHQVKNAPSYGIESRLAAKAIVVQKGGAKFAIARVDLYIPQDLLQRRAARILEERGTTGITRSNLVMAVTHDHSSPFYTSTAWGAWAFQDVFDIRAYEYWATKIADAVEKANGQLVPVRVGASVAREASTNRNALGPAVADDGTPAGFPDSYTDRDFSLIRFDDISNPDRPRPLANLVTFGLHPEGVNGNSLITGDYIVKFERQMDRRTGAMTMFTQGSTGNSEPERDAYHSVHDRLNFSHKEYAQGEWAARRMADTGHRLWSGIGSGTPEPGQESRFVPFFSDAPVAFADHWLGGPLSHPYPAVSNCRTEKILQGNPQVPVIGLPDCQNPLREYGGIETPAPLNNPGITIDDLKDAGVPVPDNYGVFSYGSLQEDVSVHLQAFRLGDILFTVCPCEQWADQSYNIKTRTDRTAGNGWKGFDWATFRGLDTNGDECFQLAPFDGSRWSCAKPETATKTPCFQEPGGTWSCPNPQTVCLLDGAAFTNTCRDGAGNPGIRDSRLSGITDHEFQRMKAQVRNCANGWNAADYLLQAESEPTDVSKIKGNYSCDDDSPRSAQLGYKLTVAMSMANDYNGYIATYREYQRGDHYRKALTGWGMHSSDYLATNLVKIGRLLNGGPGLDKKLDGSADPDADSPVLAAKTLVDNAFNDARVQGLGALAKVVTTAYEALLPNDGGPAVVTREPVDVQRFDASLFSWNGGSNYTDDPNVRVERRVGDAWEEYAGMRGELPVTLEMPRLTDLPAYLTSDMRWIWAAHFEPFVSSFDLKDTPRATPAGTYRFVVEGRRREKKAVTPYRLESAPFRVGEWSGITVEDLKAESNGTVSFRSGPQRNVPVPGGNPATATLGPIDYPDGYAGKPGRARFIRDERSVVRSPEAPADPTRFEWYCLTCSFRPWLDVGEAWEATVTFVAATEPVRAPATLGPDGRWRTTRALGAGESAYVCPGDLRDQWGNFNGRRSATIGAAAGDVCAPKAVVGVPNDGSGNVPAPPAAASTSTSTASKPALSVPKLPVAKLALP
jgi:hypothetical protein